MCNSPHAVSIHILDDDSLLNVFYLYRPAIILDGKEYDSEDRNYGGQDRGVRVSERWWYRLAQVCRRWRKIILGSASYLRLCLVCTYGTPVADMLAHSPPLPLVIDFFRTHGEITTEDEEGILLALDRRDRVCGLRLLINDPNLRDLIMAIGDEYPELECLVMTLNVERDMAFMLPTTFQTPRLRHLILKGFVLPKGSPLFATAVGLVTLTLYMEYASAYFDPNTLLHWISFMPQLEALSVVSHRNLSEERRRVPKPIVTRRVTLPNLRRVVLECASSYIEAVVCQISTPLLETLQIRFFWDRTFFVPGLFQFVNITETLRFECAKFKFSESGVCVDFYPRMETKTYPLSIFIYCDDHNCQVTAAAQVFNSLGQNISTVEHLTLEHRWAVVWRVHNLHYLTSKRNDKVDRTKWRELLRPFSNVKTLHVDNELVKELSLILPPVDGELALELFPELQKLIYYGDTGDAFTPFIDARQNTGRPVTLVRSSPRSVTWRSRSSSRSESSAGFLGVV